MLYAHDVAASFDAAGSVRAGLDRRLAALEEGLAKLRAAHQANSLALLQLPARRDDLAPARDIAAHLSKDTSDLIVLGTGGSSLGAQALVQLTGWGTPGFVTPEGRPRLHFFDNLDALTMAAALKTMDLRTTRFLSISKSGGTAETLMQTLAAMSVLERAGGGKYMKHHFAVLTEPAKNGVPNPLRKLAGERDFPVADHDPAVGGRFSALTNVGLLPAILAGLDPVAIREGAAQVLAPVLDGAPASDVAPALGAGLAVTLAEDHGIAMNVLLAYADRLEKFALWYRQLWAESLGKNGKGTTPIRALGPVDQHSQLQLYLAGPRDKWTTVLMTAAAGTGPDIAPEVAGDAFAEFAGRKIGDLVDAEQRATADTLAANGHPVRTIRLDKLDERTMGALLMHFMLETILAAHLMGVDPYDQPAVEEGKILAKNYLGTMPR